MISPVSQTIGTGKWGVRLRGWPESRGSGNYEFIIDFIIDMNDETGGQGTGTRESRQTPTPGHKPWEETWLGGIE